MRTPIGVAVVGLGPRGERLARVFGESRHADLRRLCDPSPEAQLRLRARHPRAVSCSSIQDVLADDSVDAVAIATPSATHHELALRALEAEKHVFVERPLALGAAEAQELVRTAARRHRRLVVGHQLLFHPAVRKLRELVETGRLGDVYFVSMTVHDGRRGAGDESVLWGLGADALAAVLYVLGDEPVETHGHLEGYEEEELADLACCYLRFATGIAAAIEVSWLHPQRQCRLTVAGSRRVAVFDAVDPERKLTVYDRGPGPRGDEGVEAHGEHRYGDILCPRLPNDDPLRLECDHFLASVRAPSPGLTDGVHAARVVGVLEALDTPRRAAAPAAEQAGGRVVRLPRRG